ncbi:hypothetical protein QZH41_007224 [Actinostola sp. cb2023]|nr:hypothetical protein QZH41_007224 [Actinostola sp. cb2023]
MGKNTINNIMKTMKENSPLKEVCGDKKLTNHSARKTVGKKLKSHGVPKCEIKNITGHTTEQGLDDYDSGNENEQRMISNIIDNGASDPKRRALSQPEPFQPLPVPSTSGNIINFSHCHAIFFEKKLQNYTKGSPVGRSTTTIVGPEVRLLSIAYPVMSASVSGALGTYSLDVMIEAVSSTPRKIHFKRCLPTIAELIELFNGGVRAAFPNNPDLPTIVRQAGSFAVTNPSANPITIKPPNFHAQVLWFGHKDFAPGGSLTIPSKKSSAQFLPSPRHGASFQTLIPAGSISSRSIRLPTLGTFMQPVWMTLPAQPIDPGNGKHASVWTRYPAISESIEETPNRNIEISCLLLKKYDYIPL